MAVFDQLNKRDPQLQLLAIAIAAGLGVLLCGLWWVQVVSANDFRQDLETQAFRTVRIPAIRGEILDRNGVALAENEPTYNVSLYLDELTEEFQKEYALIRPRLFLTNAFPFWQSWFGSPSVTTQYAKLSLDQKDALAWRARYAVASNIVAQVGSRLQQPLKLDFTDFQRHYETRLALPYSVASKIDPTMIARFEEQSTSPMGVDLEVQSTRYYPGHTTAAHLLGHLQRDDSSVEGEDAYFTYRLADYRGAVGVEAAFDSALRGRAGAKSVLVNNLGYRQTENVWEPAEPGHNVVLTIDLRIQRAAEQALRSAIVSGTPRGAAVVMDVHTGDILALASTPSFDPNDYTGHLTPDQETRLNDPTLRPQINRATQENYAPGSIFKPLTGLACLETGLDPDAIVTVPPNPLNPAHGVVYVGRRAIGDLAPPGNYNFRRALIHSSNTYFIQMGLRAGIEKIRELASHAHLGERTGLGTRQEVAGIFPSERRIHSGWNDGDTANICIGQGEVSVTPLQMTVFDAAIANGGDVLWSRLADRIEPQDPLSGEAPVIFPKGRVRDRLGVRPRNLQLLRDAMLADVEDPEGTGKAAAVPGFRICGKTGTAQVMNEHNQVISDTVWFMSFAPYENPRYAVVVMVESGSSGGGTCAPLAKQIYEAILAARPVKPVQNLAAK